MFILSFLALKMRNPDERRTPLITKIIPSTCAKVIFTPFRKETIIVTTGTKLKNKDVLAAPI